MKPIQERIKQQQFTAYAAYESIEFIWQRVEQLVNNGRRIIYVERWLDGGDLKVVPGQSLETRGFVPGAQLRKNAEQAYFQIALSPGINTLGAGGHVREGSESDAARRFLTDKRNGTRIRIEGFGLGGGDNIEITDYNEHGVGWQRCLYFQFEYSVHRAERDAGFLEGLAKQGDWSAQQLTELAAEVRDVWAPALEVAEEIRRAGAKS